MADQVAGSMEPKTQGEWFAQVNTEGRQLSYDEVVLVTPLQTRSLVGWLLSITLVAIVANIAVGLYIADKLAGG